MEELIYKDLSYQLVGTAFKVYNSLGFGLQEKYYQRAYEQELIILNIPYQKEYKVNLYYNSKKIGEYFLDFIIDDKIIIELKVAPRLKHIHIRQVLEYLKITNKKLALLIFFIDEGVKYQRILNPSIKQ